MWFLILVTVVFLGFIVKLMCANAAANKENGDEDKTLSQNALIGGIGCFAIPAVLMAAIMAVYGIVYSCCAVKSLFELGHPITIFFGIAIIVGSIGILLSAIMG